MNNDRIQEILDLMEEARLDYFLISDPQSIAYCTGYYNDPHERMFVFMVSKHGNHTLFMNEVSTSFGIKMDKILFKQLLMKCIFQEELELIKTGLHIFY